MASPPSLGDLPRDTLLTICDHVQPDSLLALSHISTFWHTFCTRHVWPRRIASALKVRAVRYDHPIPTAAAWMRILNTFLHCPSTTCLFVCVHLGPHDTVTSLALQYAVSRHDIFRANALFAEHQLASRTRLYVPLLSEESVRSYTGVPTAHHTPVLVRDKALSQKCFLVVKFRAAPPLPTSDTRPQIKSDSYVRQLVVKLIAKGLSVHEDEVRFYLEDTQFDVAKAYKHLLADRQFAP